MLKLNRILMLLALLLTLGCGEQGQLIQPQNLELTTEQAKNHEMMQYVVQPKANGVAFIETWKPRLDWKFEPGDMGYVVLKVLFESENDRLDWWASNDWSKRDIIVSYMPSQIELFGAASYEDPGFAQPAEWGNRAIYSLDANDEVLIPFRYIRSNEFSDNYVHEGTLNNLGKGTLIRFNDFTDGEIIQQEDWIIMEELLNDN